LPQRRREGIFRSKLFVGVRYPTLHRQGTALRFSAFGQSQFCENGGGVGDFAAERRRGAEYVYSSKIVGFATALTFWFFFVKKKEQQRQNTGQRAGRVYVVSISIFRMCDVCTDMIRSSARDTLSELGFLGLEDDRILDCER
jgi:hypothetical protein